MSPQRVQRKPLELRIFPPIKECPKPSDLGYAYEDWFEDRSYERKLSAKKRLKDPELASEVWHSIVQFNSLVPSPEAAQEAARNAVIERFATHPDYDETER